MQFALGHSAFAPGVVLQSHLEGFVQTSAGYDGSTSTAITQEM